jgi:hypothetical protein
MLRNDYLERQHIPQMHTFRGILLEDPHEGQEVRLERGEVLAVEALGDAKREIKNSNSKILPAIQLESEVAPEEALLQEPKAADHTLKFKINAHMSLNPMNQPPPGPIIGPGPGGNEGAEAKTGADA